MHPISLSFPPPAQMLVHIYTYMCRKYHAKAAVLSFIRGGVVFHTHARTHARTTPHHHHDDDVRLYVCIHHQLFLHRDHPSICSHEIYMYMYIRHAQVRPSLSSVFPSQSLAASCSLFISISISISISLCVSTIYTLDDSIRATAQPFDDDSLSP